MVAQAPILVPGARLPILRSCLPNSGGAPPGDDAEPPGGKRPTHACGATWLPMAGGVAPDGTMPDSRLRDARLPIPGGARPEGGRRGSRWREARLPMARGAAPDGERRASRRREARLPMVDLPVDHNRGRVDVELRHLRGDDVALGLHHPLVQLALEVRERARAPLRLQPLLFEELAQLLKGRGPGLSRDTRGQLHARRSVRRRHAPSNPRPLAEIPAIPASGSDLHPAVSA